MPRPFRLSRRAMLGGAGALIALPWLEAMAPVGRRAKAAMDPALRFLAWYVPNGIHMQSWTPQNVGPGYDIPLILEPLTDLQSDVMVLSGLTNLPGKPEGPGDHAGGTSAFLTCTHVKKSEDDIVNNISMDQVLANAIGDQTKHASLQLGIEGGGNVGNCDSGYSCAYTRNISWAGPKSPMPKLTDPQVVFDLLFAGFDPEASAEELEARRKQRLSVLDYALDDINSLRVKLGTSDQAKLDQYLTGVNELEQRIKDEAIAPVCELPPGWNGDYDNFPAQLDLMIDVMILAMQCDMTRVITFMYQNAGSYRDYAFIGAPGAHHEISHHMGLAENFAKLEIIDQWEVLQFAKLIQRMKDTPDGDGKSLLDNSLVYFSAEISDGNAHNHNNMPVLLCGSGGGSIKSGRHLKFDNEPPVANLFTTILNTLGVPNDKFGDDGTGPLSLA
ncbi:MAG: DUF1552 domain-containing protein [Myxococcales bacterium]|nr:DUF1552 domain-containing protein [Myxococcales bacterium]MCB9705610.1 DUF1552 domain-containing protein [Myxococcales bacterium]